MSFIRNIKNIWNLASMEGNLLPMDNMLSYLDFFQFTGSKCSPGFEVDLNSYNGIDEAYRRCSPLSTIIGRNAMAMANGKWWITDKKDNDKSDKYKQISKLLKNPNPLQSWTEFQLQLDTYRQLDGEVFVLASVPVGSTIQESSALWVVRRKYIEIELTGKLFLQNDIDGIVKKYYLLIDSDRIEINKDDILHIKDTHQNLNFSPLDIRGRSRIQGLGDCIRNIVQANEAIYAINKDRGAFGILSNVSKDAIGSIPLTKEEKDRIDKEYLSGYGLSRRQKKIMLTDASLSWQSMSFNVKDLMLFEGIKSNIQQLADALMYPYNLLSGGSETSFNNQDNSEKRLYQDNIIPVSNIYSEKFTEFFQLDRDRIYIDFSHIEVLKESEKERADTLLKMSTALDKLYKSGIISREEFRLAIDYDEEISGTTMYQNGNQGQNTEGTRQNTDTENQGQ